MNKIEPESYNLDHKIIEHILKTPDLIAKMEKALLKSWEEDVLDEIIANSYYTKESKLELIMQEDLYQPDLDELRGYFDFRAYSDHMQTLIDAGLIPPSSSIEDKDEDENVIEGQPKLFDE